MFASFRNHSLIVANLLAHGADSTTVTSRWGYTALDIAQKEGHTDVVKLLEAHQRLHCSTTAVRIKAEYVRPADDWLLGLLKCGSCDAVLARKDFPSHGIEVHAGDKTFEWKSSDVKSCVLRICLNISVSLVLLQWKIVRTKYCKAMSISNTPKHLNCSMNTTA
jgi:hypothetical protein